MFTLYGFMVSFFMLYAVCLLSIFNLVLILLLLAILSRHLFVSSSHPSFSSCDLQVRVYCVFFFLKFLYNRLKTTSGNFRARRISHTIKEDLEIRVQF